MSEEYIAGETPQLRWVLRMFGFKKKSSSIDVEFYEPGKLEPFARSSLPIEDLPDTFEIETTLTIQGEQWRVSNARPATKEEFRKTGWVQVFLNKLIVERIPVDRLFFTLPTISDDIAGLEEAQSLENVFVVHEDDWRQQELVSGAFTENILKELEAIRQIYETERVEHGFEKVHVRSSIPAPLRDVRLTLADIQSRLGMAHAYRGATFSHVAGVIHKGFAFRTEEGSVIWGQRRQHDELAVVCIRFAAPGSPDLRKAAAMDSLLSEFNVFFVDWVNQIIIPPIDNE